MHDKDPTEAAEDEEHEDDDDVCVWDAGVKGGSPAWLGDG